MRSLVGTYLSIGILLLLLGFFATGPCPDKNRDVVSHKVCAARHLHLNDMMCLLVTLDQWQARTSSRHLARASYCGV